MTLSDPTACGPAAFPHLSKLLPQLPLNWTYNTAAVHVPCQWQNITVDQTYWKEINCKKKANNCQEAFGSFEV